MNKPIALLALTAGALAATPALSAELGWTYGQLGYTRADSGDDATDAVRLKGSLGLSELFHVQAEYLDGTIGQDGDEDNDFDGYRLALGVHPSVGENTQAVLELQYFDVTYDDVGGPGVDEDDDGFGIGAGLRHLLTDNFEMNAMVSWNEGSSDIEGFEDNDFSDVAFEFGGRYFMNDAMSVGVTVITNDSLMWGGDSATLDFRWQFADLL